MDMDMEQQPFTVEEAYLRIFSTRTREKYFPQYFKTDLNGNTELELPMFQEPELRDSTSTARHPETRSIPEYPAGSKSQMNMNYPNLHPEMEKDEWYVNRPTTAPESSASPSTTRVKSLSRTATQILVPQHRGLDSETINTANESKVHEYFGGAIAILKSTSKKSVAFKTQLVEDEPPQSLPDLELPIERNDSSTQAVLEINHAKTFSRIPIPVFRARATTAISPPLSAPSPPADPKAGAGINKTGNLLSVSTPKPRGNRNIKKTPSSKPTNSGSNSNSEELLRPNSDQVVSSPSEILDISQEETVEFYKAGPPDFIRRTLSEASGKGLQGVSDETVPQLYDSDTSISTTTTQDDDEDELNSHGESSTTIVFKCDNKPSISATCTGDHHHNPQTSYESHKDYSTMASPATPKISHHAITLTSESDRELRSSKSGIIPCRYSTAGCSEELPRGTTVEEEHYQHCRYRPIPCLFNRICNEIVPYHNFILHHNSHFMHPNYTSTLMTSVVIHSGDFLFGETWIPKWLSTFDNHFFLMLSHTRGRSIGTGTWLCWLWMLGTTEEAGDYSYEVEIFKGLRKVSGTFTAQSIRTSAEEVEKTKSGIVFTDTVARHLAGMTKNVIGDFLIDVIISKKPPTHQENPSYTGPYKPYKNPVDDQAPKAVS